MKGRVMLDLRTGDFFLFAEKGAEDGIDKATSP
jgi:hypothetical protein